MDNSLNESIEKIVMHKANLIMKSQKYKEYIEKLLSDRDISSNGDVVQVFLMGAVDAMIYDVGCALDFTKQKSGSHDWTSYAKRKQVLGKLFPLQ